MSGIPGIWGFRSFFREGIGVIIIPAIDLHDGKCVRLLQGDDGNPAFQLVEYLFDEFLKSVKSEKCPSTRAQGPKSEKSGKSEKVS